MEEALESTTPFLTIDPMVSDRLEPVHSALCGGDWKGLIHNDVQLKERLISQGVETKKFSELYKLYTKLSSEIDWPSQTKIIHLFQFTLYPHRHQYEQSLFIFFIKN